ncbi:MAG: hypothetical protein EOS46_27905 [Mesorhizobium sp.]|uniref:hypothetical protein n=1 Tax=Mesorhizobium sp. TaxID=1871066 RepID=UPI000FE7FE82|nr:hypothetical protein [Mesorhizobium sp.]RWF41620.1 MAG: hypothetical protein EOS46_27905 [Mesorhizobium sp.]
MSNKSTIIMRRRGHALHATAQWEGDMLETFPEGCDLNVAVSRARSLRQNNTYWGLLGWVIENGPEWIGGKWPEADHLSDALQIDLGYVRYVGMFGGEVRAFPESKSFQEMPQDKFNRYFTAVQGRLTEMCNYDPLPIYLARGRERTAA